ncbi:hypothetical protein Tco_0672090 [Tanacetum coccineum]
MHIYSTGWTKAKVESFTDAQLKEEFEKIQKALENTQDPISWSALVGCDVISTPLGRKLMLLQVGSIYQKNKIFFYHSKEILQYADRHDLLTLYGKCEIRSWRLYTLSNVHSETVSGEVLYMFADVNLILSHEAHGKDA